MAIAIDNPQLPDGFTLESSSPAQPQRTQSTPSASATSALPDGFTLESSQPAAQPTRKQLPPMTRHEADAYLQNLATHGQGTFQPSKPASFANTALVDPESPVFGEPIKSAIHPDTRNGRNLVPVQNVAAVRQQMQYDAANPDVAARIDRANQMDTSLPLAQRLANRAGLEARKRTELGQAVSNVNDQYLNYLGNKGSDTGEAFAQFMARNFQTENPQATPGEIGAARSIGKNVLRTVADPTMQASVITGGVGGKVGQVALSSLFAAGAGKASYDAAGQLGSIWDRQDIPSSQKAELATDLVLNTAVAGLAGRHAVKAGLLTPSDPMLSGLPPEAKFAITRRVNDALSKTGGILSSAASTASDLFNKLPAAPAEGFQQLPDPRQVVTQRVVDAAPKVGVQLNTADNALQAIKQARADTLAHHENIAGGNLGDASPDQADSMNTELDLLNTMEDHIQAGRDAAQQNANKPQQTRAAATMDLLKGVGKAAVVHGSMMAADSMIPGLASSPIAPIALELAGISRFGGPQIAKGIKGILSKGPMTPDMHDAVVQKMFSGFQPATQPFQAADMPAGPDPFAQQGPAATDTSVQHTSNIAPPSTAAGDAQLYPDLPRQFNVSSGATFNPADLMQRLKAGAARMQGNTPVQTSTAFPASVTPQLEPRQLNLAPSAQPETVTEGAQNAARNAAEIKRQSAPAPNAVDAKAAQTMTPDYLGRHGSALDQARAEWQATNPGQPVPAWDSGIMRRADEIDAQMRQGAPQPASQPQAGQSANAGGDIFKNDQEMQDWLDRQEQNNPVLQRVKDLAKERIKNGDLPEGLRPSPQQQAQIDRQIQQMIQEAKYGPQGIDTPAQLDKIDQWIRATNVQPKPFQAGRPLKTAQKPLEGQDLIAGLMDMKAKADAAKAAAQTAGLGTATTVPPVQQGASMDAIRQALSKPVDPTSASAAQLSMLRDELIRTTDPAQKLSIQQAIDHLQAVTTGRPFSVTDQATAENLPASQPREIEPGTYIRETKQTIPAGANIIRANSPTIPASQLQMGDTAFVNPQEVKLDPSRFQFKHNVSERGVTNQFADVKKFDENLAGVIDAFKDPATGELYAVNGHHRTALAQDLNAPRMKVNVMDTQDAVEARARGAAKNLAEGRGTGFDAAVFLRDSGLNASDLDSMGISLSDAKVNTALALKNLSPEILDKVGNGTLDEGRAVAIGQATDNPDLQRQILDMVQNKEKSGNKISNDVVASLAKHVVNSPNYETQTQSLFGPQVTTNSLALEKAQVDAGILRNLRGEKAAFGAVKSQSRAEQLGRAGNVIKPEENKAIADRANQAIELYNRLSQRAGPVNRAVETGAIEMSLGHGTKQEIIDRTTQQIRQILDQELSGGQPGQSGSGTPLESPR